MNLQLVLISLGVILLVAIYLTWKWQERRQGGQGDYADHDVDAPIATRAAPKLSPQSTNRIAPAMAPMRQVADESALDDGLLNQGDDQHESVVEEALYQVDTDTVDSPAFSDRDAFVNSPESTDQPDDLSADNIDDYAFADTAVDYSEAVQQMDQTSELVLSQAADDFNSPAKTIEPDSDEPNVEPMEEDDIPELDPQLDLVSHTSNQETLFGDGQDALDAQNMAIDSVDIQSDDSTEVSVNDQIMQESPVEADLNLTGPDETEADESLNILLEPLSKVSQDALDHHESAVDQPASVESPVADDLVVEAEHDLRRVDIEPVTISQPDAINRVSEISPVAAEANPVSDSVDPLGGPSIFIRPEIEGFEKLSQIDYWVKLSGERDVSRDSVLAVYRDASMSLSKLHSIHGLRVPEKVWCNLEDQSEDARFADLVITIQLADQRGGISESELTRFTALVSKLSETTGRGFSFMAPVESAMQQANALSEFKNYYDSIFVVNIKPVDDDYFEGPRIDRCASQLGLERDSDQFYTRYKPIGKTRVGLYSLANMSETGQFDFENMKVERTRGVTFFTKPAVNRSPGAVFAEMVDTAKAFASRIKGEPIAPGQDDLTQDDVEEIRRNIEKVAAEMESFGMTPGSEEASRLF